MPANLFPVFHPCELISSAGTVQLLCSGRLSFASLLRPSLSICFNRLQCSSVFPLPLLNLLFVKCLYCLRSFYPVCHSPAHFFAGPLLSSCRAALQGHWPNTPVLLHLYLILYLLILSTMMLFIILNIMPLILKLLNHFVPGSCHLFNTIMILALLVLCHLPAMLPLMVYL
ncbi:hypothetical protein F4604DRAFT_1734015 [Suillus subluteus]|nr:hypothetical protein F4604DRAFT_1734015 [Suillus subluteus]